MDLVKQKIAFQQHIDQLAEAMVTRNAGRHGTHTVLPFTLFFGDDISIFKTSAEFDEQIGQFARRLRAAGMIDLRGAVLDCVQDDEERFHCKVEWFIETRVSGWIATCIGYYYMTDPGEDFRVHMVSYEDHPDPLAFDWVASKKLFDMSRSPVNLVSNEPSVDLEKFASLLQDVLNDSPQEGPTTLSKTQNNHYVLPLTVFYENQINVFDSTAQLDTQRKSLFARLTAVGIIDIERTITDVQLQDDNRFTAKGIWKFTTPLGQKKHLSDAAFSGTNPGPDFKIDVIRMRNLEFNDLFQWAGAISQDPAIAPAAPQTTVTPLRRQGFGKVDLSQVETRRDTLYPAPFDQEVKGRTSQSVGEAGGITQFGANIVTLEPNAKSSIRRWHENQDEFAYVVSGELVLFDNNGETPMRAGDCATFPANVKNAHCFINRSDSPAQFLIVSSCVASEIAHYPDLNMKAEIARGVARFLNDDAADT